MKRFILAILALLLIFSMSAQAFAVTPKLEVPNIPQVPAIKVEVKLPQNFWDNWFASHPLKINWNG